MNEFIEKIDHAIRSCQKALKEGNTGAEGEATEWQLKDHVIPELLKLRETVVNNEKLPAPSKRYLPSYTSAFMAWSWRLDYGLMEELSQLDKAYKSYEKNKWHEISADDFAARIIGDGDYLNRTFNSLNDEHLFDEVVGFVGSDALERLVSFARENGKAAKVLTAILANITSARTITTRIFDMLMSFDEVQRNEYAVALSKLPCMAVYQLMYIESLHVGTDAFESLLYTICTNPCFYPQDVQVLLESESAGNGSVKSVADKLSVPYKQGNAVSTVWQFGPPDERKLALLKCYLEAD